ncbi:MAG TPA: serine hydrolase domain-containing protein [Candidatus Limnocylindria bacterium]|nr:serine hydrolase domain-containing protein [Candidatus Limnocylindria bacterium]
MSTRLVPALRDVARRLVANEEVPGASVAILQDDLLVSAHAGTRGATGSLEADDQTLYRVASISKTFTAWGVLALRDSGRISLDDPVVDHLPEFTAVSNPFGPIARITIRSLLQHSSGLQSEPPGDVPEPWRPRPIEEVLSLLARTAVVVPPGSAFKYSNVGYDLLGELIRRVSGTPYATYAQLEVLRPLGMGRTALDPPPGPDRAIGFDPTDPLAPHGPRRPAIDHGSSASQASGGWWSCIEDLAMWLRAQLGPNPARSPVSDASLDEMHTPAQSTDAHGGAYGLGWRVAQRAGRSVVGHGGITHGFEATIGFDREARTAAIVLVNGIPSPGSMLELRDRLLDLASSPPTLDLAGIRSPSTPPGPPTVRATGSSWLVGTFREAGFRDEVTIAPGPVLVEEGGARRVLVATDDPMRFLVCGGRCVGESLRLLRDASGELTAIELGGYYFNRLREPDHLAPGSPRPRREDTP